MNSVQGSILLRELSYCSKEVAIYYNDEKYKNEQL